MRVEEGHILARKKKLVMVGKDLSQPPLPCPQLYVPMLFATCISVLFLISVVHAIFSSPPPLDFVFFDENYHDRCIWAVFLMT